MFRTKCKEHDHSDFYQFLQMEPTHKNNDCYFFYYSTCTKGDACAFRHEPSALGCEVMCSYWQQGNCLNEHCNFRHMELKKNRKSIPCFWESQRGGCKKPHCPFLHASVRATTNLDAPNPIKTAEVTSKPVTQEWSNRPDDGKYDGSGTESDQGRGSSEAGSFIGSPAVDPLIVNFDEESDSESASSPVKPHTARVPYCKTYEEIRLEEIQAESAAYYSYEPDDYLGSIGGGKEKRVTSVRAARRAVLIYSREKPVSVTTTTTTSAGTTTTAASESPSRTGESSTGDFTILTLEEIRRRRAAQAASKIGTGIGTKIGTEIGAKIGTEIGAKIGTTIDTEIGTSLSEETSRVPVRRKELPVRSEDNGKESGDFLKNAIKTLAELKAANSTRLAPLPSRKRTIESADLYTPEEEIEINRISKMSKVPPVRLRRSPKRFTRGATSGSAGEPIERSSSESASRPEEIEVRLCDSSTSDDVQTSTIESTTAGASLADGDAVGATPATPDDLKLEQLCDTNLSANDDEYLTVDTASDDILKDIDALLTEKSTV